MTKHCPHVLPPPLQAVDSESSLAPKNLSFGCCAHRRQGTVHYAPLEPSLWPGKEPRGWAMGLRQSADDVGPAVLTTVGGPLSLAGGQVTVAMVVVGTPTIRYLLDTGVG